MSGLLKHMPFMHRGSAAPRSPSARTSVLRKLILWSLAGLLLFSLTGFLILPPILKSVMTAKLSEALHREVRIKQIQINPFALSVTVTEFIVSDIGRPDPFVSFEELYVNLESISILKGGPVLSEIHLKAPYARIIRNDDLTYNFSDLLDAFASKPPAEPAPPKESKPLLFSLNNIQILGGSVDFIDRPKHADHTVRDLTITIPFLSNLPSLVSIHVEPLFQATVNGSPFVLRGKSKPFHDSHETQLDIEIDGIDIPKYVEYVPMALKFKIPSATLDSKLAVSFIQYKDKGPALIVAGRVALNKLAITDLSDAPLLSVPLLETRIDAIEVFAKTVRLAGILLQSPEVHLRRDKKGLVNMTALAPETKEEPRAKGESPAVEQKPAGAAPIIEIAEIKLADGTVTFSDYSLEKPFQTAIHPLTVTLSHFSTERDKSTGVDLSLSTSAGETLTHTGTFTLQPLGADGTVSLKNIPLNRYMPYLPPTLLLDIAAGTLGVSTTYHYKKAPGSDQMTCTSLAIALNDLRVKKKGEKAEFLKIPSLAVKHTDIDVTARTVSLGDVSTHRGVIHVTRARDGTIDLAGLVATAPTTEKPGKSVSPATPPPAPSPWIIHLKKFTLDRYAVTVDDHVPAATATLVADPITVTAERLSTEKGRTGSAHVRLTLNKTGNLAVGGTVSLSPFAATLNLDAKGFDLVPLQPYFTDVLNITVTSGALSTAGTIAVAAKEKTGTAVTFDGNAALTKLATLDKATSEDFAKWDALTVNGIHVSTAPVRLAIKDIALTAPVVRIVVQPDGTLNLQHLAARGDKARKDEPAAAPPSQGEPGAPPSPSETSVTVETVRLEGGTISLLDSHITPHYAAKLAQIDAKVTGLTSEEGKPAELSFKAKLDDTSPLEAVGKLNPLAKSLYADVKIDFKDMDLSAATPYSGKYAGYTIEKGKLSLDLKYLIDKRKLEAANKVFIDQFTFGDKVDSPSATKLPVKLAVSLLKDRKGEIRLDFPVSGSLDDPEFSVWGVVLQVITNLLTKAATSPFALLGSMMGGGEELSYVEFAPGMTALDAAAESKLNTLAKGLTERPSLKIEVSGRTDPEQDRERYTRVLFDRKVKAQKVAELVKQGESVTSVDQTVVAPDEYPTYLAKAYKKETFPKPKNFFGFTKDLPVPEMEQLMLSHIQVTDDDLRQLAIQRAQTVKDYLVAAGKIDSERIFLVEKRAAASTKAPAAKESRVDFSIQ